MLASAIKFSLVALLIATLLWASIVLYLRSRRREGLEAAAAAIPPGERASYIREGMREHSRTMLRLSVLLSWLMAGAIVVGIVWYVNFN